MVKDDIVLYLDENHLTNSGANLIIVPFLREHLDLKLELSEDTLYSRKSPNRGALELIKSI